MPALIYDRLVVLHTPKTGGVWLIDALRQHTHIRGELMAPGGWGHPTLAEVCQVIADRPIIAAVREPSAWLRSFWGFFRQHAWVGSKLGPVPLLEPLLALGTDDLHEFVRRYLAQCPGYITTVLRAYTVGAAIVCRQEHLGDDICAAFHNMGEPLADPATFLQRPPMNVTAPRVPALSRGEVAAIRCVDRWVVDHSYPELAGAVD